MPEELKIRSKTKMKISTAPQLVFTLYYALLVCSLASTARTDNIMVNSSNESVIEFDSSELPVSTTTKNYDYVKIPKPRIRNTTTPIATPSTTHIATPSTTTPIATPSTTTPIATPSTTTPIATPSTTTPIATPSTTTPIATSSTTTSIDNSSTTTTTPTTHNETGKNILKTTPGTPPVTDLNNEFSTTDGTTVDVTTLPSTPIPSNDLYEVILPKRTRKRTINDDNPSAYSVMRYWSEEIKKMPVSFERASWYKDYVRNCEYLYPEDQPIIMRCFDDMKRYPFTGRKVEKETTTMDFNEDESQKIQQSLSDMEQERFKSILNSF